MESGYAYLALLAAVIAALGLVARAFYLEWRQIRLLRREVAKLKRTIDGKNRELREREERDRSSSGKIGISWPGETRAGGSEGPARPGRGIGTAEGVSDPSWRRRLQEILDDLSRSEGS